MLGGKSLQAAYLSLLVLQLDTRSLELADDLLETGISLADTSLCVLDYIRGHTKTLGDRKGVGLSGRAHDKPVSRTESLYVEFAGSVLDVRAVYRKDLELLIVSRDHYLGAALHKTADYRYRKRCTLYRIGSGAELVKQHERILVRSVEYLDDLVCVRRER